MTNRTRALVFVLFATICAPLSLAQSQVESGFVNVDGGKLYYESSGSGQPLVLIHGFTLDRRMWDFEFAELSKRFRTIRYDLRGHGKSSGVSAEFNPVDDLAMLLDALEVNQVYLIGLSLGGRIAIDFSIAYSGRVRTAVLIDPGYPLPKSYPFEDRVAKYISLARQGNLNDGLTQWLEDPLFEPACEHNELKEKLRNIVLVGHGALGDGSLFVNADKQANPRRLANKTPSNVGCPVLLLMGKRDLPRFHAVTDYLSRTIPDITVVTVPDAGHMANMENPAFVITQIGRFLSR